MTRLTITVEGEADDVREALVRFLGGDLIGLPAPSRVAALDQQPEGGEEAGGALEPPVTWSYEELARLWAYLTDAARRVLREVAERPDGYRFEDLERALGMEMRRIGGTLSSVGHAMRRLYRVDDAYVKPWPLVGDKYKRVYLMDESVAEMVRELAGHGGAAEETTVAEG